jgi:O-acetyl-ADP-ribose deacetylase (regulator of RNase III)
VFGPKTGKIFVGSWSMGDAFPANRSTRRRVRLTQRRRGADGLGRHAGSWPVATTWDTRRVVAIEVVLGDITRERVDAIVNAANASLLGGGGVDGAIHRAAGPRLARAGEAIGPCPPGDAMATPAFDLDPPVAHIIHTVGPIWEGGGYGEADVLRSCYRRCLEVADELGARTLAFPAIATGAYGFPADRAAQIAITTIRCTPTSVLRARMVAFDEATRTALQTALNMRPH